MPGGRFLVATLRAEQRVSDAATTLPQYGQYLVPLQAGTERQMFRVLRSSQTLWKARPMPSKKARLIALLLPLA